MNLVETWVNNITMHTEVDGIHLVKADFDCYGRKEYQVEKWLTDSDYKSVLNNGYYLT